MEDNNLIKNIYEDIAMLKMVGAKVVIVHGGGKKISASLAKNGVKTEFISGYRVTGPDSIEIIEQVLSGGVNKSIVQGLKNEKLNACGLSGKDAGLIFAEKKIIPDGDIGYVGEVKKVDVNIISMMLSNDIIPVISPISSSINGETLNVNADDAAFAVAEALKVNTLVFLTDVDGILLDINNNSTIINDVPVSKCRELLENGFIGGGMLPKLKNCINSVENGVDEVAIINGTVKYNLISYFITKGKIGSTIN